MIYLYILAYQGDGFFITRYNFVAAGFSILLYSLIVSLLLYAFTKGSYAKVAMVMPTTSDDI